MTRLNGIHSTQPNGIHTSQPNGIHSHQPHGMHSIPKSRSPEPGIYAPIITIFTNDKKQDLDLEAQAIHAVRYSVPAGFIYSADQR